MNKSIKVNNQTVGKILEVINQDKNRYPELWEIISGQKINGEEAPNNSDQEPNIKFIGNLDFLNLKKIESPKLLAELTERISRGEISLNVFDCCYLMRCFSFIRQNIEATNIEKSKENKRPTPPITVKELDVLVMMVLHWLKKDNLLCPNHSKLMEGVEKKEIEIEDKKITN